MNNRKYIDEYSGKAKSTRYSRFRKQRRKEIRKIQECKNKRWYPSGYSWSDYIWWYDCKDKTYDGDNYYLFNRVPTYKAYPKRWFRVPASSYLKKVSHRKVRRHNNEYRGKSNISDKEYEFWWILT